MTRIKRVALYARVSTRDGRQNTENQLRIMRELAEREEWRIVREYVDQDSGANRNRPELAELFADAGRRRFDALIVYDLSRLTREGPAQAFAYVERLRAAGVQFRSATEPYFDTTAGIGGDVFLAIAAWFAKEERRMIRQRVRDGLARAVAQGKQLGPPTIAVDVDRLIELRDQGLSIREIAAATQVKRSTIERRLKAHAKKAPEPRS